MQFLRSKIITIAPGLTICNGLRGGTARDAAPLPMALRSVRVTQCHGHKEEGRRGGGRNGGSTACSRRVWEWLVSAAAGVNFELYEKKGRTTAVPHFKAALGPHAWLPLVDTKGARFLRFNFVK